MCYIGEVEKAEKLPRGEIRELPSQYPDTLYYKFTVKKWTRLPAPVKLHRKINICDFTDLASLVTTV